MNDPYSSFPSYYTGNTPPVSPPQGNAGGTSAGNPNTWYGPAYVTGGGGGAGIAGGRGVGGHGVIIPTPFRDPVVAPGPTGAGIGMSGPDTTSVTITNGGTGYPASGSGVLVNIAPSVGFGTGMTVNYTSVGGVINAVTVATPGTPVDGCYASHPHLAQLYVQFEMCDRLRSKLKSILISSRNAHSGR